VRVLIVLVAMVGCYDPPLDDCQFTCPSNKCPGDLVCTVGVCRVPGASGTCACPSPPLGCTLLDTGRDFCLASCADTRIWNDAFTSCAMTPPWRLAVLDASNKLSSAEDVLRSPVAWIALSRSAIGDDWSWVGGSGTIGPLASDWSSDLAHSGKVNTCAALNNGALYSDDCTTAHAYACTSN